jgi:hypothetical protein
MERRSPAVSGPAFTHRDADEKSFRRSAESRFERGRAAVYNSPMQLSELLPALHQLPRADKFRAVQFLTTELAQDEGGLVPGAEYPVWSPYEAHEAAAALTQYFREQTGPK